MKKYPKIFVGDRLTIDGFDYMCTLGLNQNKKDVLKDKKFNKLKYQVALRSMKLPTSTSRNKEYITILNTEIQNYKH